MAEYNHDYGKKLIQCMEKQAGLLRKRLIKDCMQAPPFAHLYDGRAMIVEIGKIDAVHSDTTMRKAKLMLAQLEANKLQNGADGDAVAKYFNTMIRDINPYLEETKQGKVLSRWMKRMMPPSCYVQVTAAEQNAKWDLDNPEDILQLLVDAAVKTLEAAEQAGGMHAFMGVPCNGCVDCDAMNSTPGAGWHRAHR